MKVQSAKLVPALIDLSQFVIGQLLAGVKVNVFMDGHEHEGLIVNIDLAPGKSDHLFAKVNIPGLDMDVKVAIDNKGNVSVLPRQD